jgi:hypothetical protein
MNASALIVGLALTTVIATTSPVFSQQGPPPSERANQKLWSRKLPHSSIAKERQLSQISERKTVSGSMLTRICLSTTPMRMCCSIPLFLSVKELT